MTYLEISKVFRDVATRMWDGRASFGNRFICIAISNTEYGHRQVVLNAAKHIIRSRIEPYTTVEQWLAANVPGIGQDAESIDIEVIQDYRIRWLNALADEYQAKAERKRAEMVADRESLHDALVQAKMYLSPKYYNGGKEQFICHALNRVKSNWRGAEGARRMIAERLGDYTTVEEWLRAKIGRVPYLTALQNDSNTTQQYRHRWLDSLIQEFAK